MLLSLQIALSIKVTMLKKLMRSKSNKINNNNKNNHQRVLKLNKKLMEYQCHIWNKSFCKNKIKQLFLILQMHLLKLKNQRLIHYKNIKLQILLKNHLKRKKMQKQKKIQKDGLISLVLKKKLNLYLMLILVKLKQKKEK